MSDNTKPFFVGYLAIPAPLRRFLGVTAALLIMGFIALSLLIGGTQDDPGNAAFRFDYGRQTVTGVVSLTPYPLLHVTIGNDLIQPGHTLMLAGSGKNGVEARAVPLNGQLATVTGVVLERGTIDMLQLIGGERGLSAAEGQADPVIIEPLGRWKLAGEICDGKCLNGAMRPGRGIAHKACAALCLLGDVPPVFVTTQAVEGSEFMLITGPDGAPLPDAAYDFIGQFITVEGELERHGGILVLRMDPATMVVTGA